MAIGYRNPKVYLQGAPFGRDLIHLDRQICRGLAVRLLTVVAAWVRKAQGRGWRMLVEMVGCPAAIRILLVISWMYSLIIT